MYMYIDAYMDGWMDGWNARPENKRLLFLCQGIHRRDNPYLAWLRIIYGPMPLLGTYIQKVTIT